MILSLSPEEAGSSGATSSPTSAAEIWQPVVKAKRAPEQTAAMSNPAALVAPSFSCTMQAEAGAGRSGVAVASTIRSNSEAAMPAMSIRLEGKNPFDEETGEIDPGMTRNCLLAFCYEPNKMDEHTQSELERLIAWLGARDPETVDDPTE